MEADKDHKNNTPHSDDFLHSLDDTCSRNDKENENTDSGVDLSKGAHEMQGPHNWRKSLRPVNSPTKLFEPIFTLPEDASSTQSLQCDVTNTDPDSDLTVPSLVISESPLVSPRSSNPSPLSGDSRPHTPRERLTPRLSNIRESPHKDKMKKQFPVSRRDSDKRFRGHLTPTKVKHEAASQQNQIGSNYSPLISRRKSGQRTLHATAESPFTRNVVNGTGGSHPNSRANSPFVSRKKNVTNNTRIPVLAGADKRLSGVHRLPSQRGPHDTAAPSNEVIKKRIMKVMRARLYLLQPLGPNSFLIGGDSPDHKYRVIIGPQRCSCSRAFYCVHVLFVMLRVFQLAENDPMVWSKTLKEYEVEALFRKFHTRRTSMIRDLRKAPKAKQKENTPDKIHAEDQSTTSGPPDTSDSPKSDEEDEEETCPICLLEMVEGESITECSHCENKLHQHCIAIWFAGCQQENGHVLCPLCRAVWKSSWEVKNEEVNTSTHDALQAPAMPVPPNTRAPSPTPSNYQESDVQLPHTEPIASEHEDTARPWLPILGEDLTACLFSKNWQAREAALRELSRRATGTLLLSVGEGRTGAVVSADRQENTQAMLACTFSVLAYMCFDPVYKVFVSCLKTLRTVLSYTPCRDEQQRARLHHLLLPVIHTILWKCADSNKRTSQLSMSALQELMKGEGGELAVGKELVNGGSLGLGSTTYIVTCITSQTYDPVTVQWQWILGRMNMLDKMLEDSPDEFIIHKDPNAQPSCEDVHYERVFSLLRFIKQALSHSHQRVGKFARYMFYLLARLQTHNRAVFSQIIDLLNDVETNVQVSMKRRLLRAAEEYHLAHNVKHSSTNTAAAAAGEPGEFDALTTPVLSATSTPRCTTPVHPSQPEPSSGDTTTDPTTGTSSTVYLGDGTPEVPPNSPRRRHRHVSQSTQTDTDTDSQPHSQVSLECVPIQKVGVEALIVPDASVLNRPVSDMPSGVPTTPVEQRSLAGSLELLSPTSPGVVVPVPSPPDHPQQEVEEEEIEVEEQALVMGSPPVRPSQVLGGVRRNHRNIEVTDACVETSPKLHCRGGLRRMRPVLHYKGPHPHPKVQLRQTSHDPDLKHEDTFKIVDEAAYDRHREQVDPLNNSFNLGEEQEDASTSTHEVIIDENGDSVSLLDQDMAGSQRSSRVLEPGHILLEEPVSVLPANLNVSREAQVSDDELSSIHGSQDNLAHEVDSQDSLHGSHDSLHNSHSSLPKLDSQDSLNSLADDNSISSMNATANSTTGNLSEDFAELLSPGTSSDDKVSFKTEVAMSPQHGGQQQAGSSSSSGSSHTCHCKEEVEQEEAQALVAAIERSEQQQAGLPFVPGLSRANPDDTMTIHVQADTELTEPTGEQYLEGEDWVRGPMIGTGAFSTCYQARDSKTGTLMCVKQISYCRNSLQEQERVIETVREEIELMAKLNHPNVVRILGATQQGCHFFMFVEWMPGGSVAYLLDRYGSFLEPVIISYTQQILRGLSYLHENHMLHRDLKGANLLVDSTGQRVRIGDFGAAARLASRQTAAGEFQGQLLGTIAFMAPEVLRGESYGRSCDVWSIGCVILEMITTKPPWGANDISNHLALIFKIASAIAPPPIPDNLNPGIKDLILRCLEVNRNDRPTAPDLLKHPLFTMPAK